MSTLLLDTLDPQELNREILAARVVLSQANLGCVAYLNSRPLIYGVENLFDLDHPANLAKKLRAGQLQGALVPVHELLTGPDYQIADGMGITSDGPVYSVFMVHRENSLSDLDHICLTTESRSSRALLRILLGKFENLDVQYNDGTFPGLENMTPRTGYLLIGDAALRLRAEMGNAPEISIYDLGTAWQQHTGLPFVFAVWTLRPEVKNPERLTKALNLTAELGLLNRNRLAYEQTLLDPEVAQKYLSEHIRYRLGDREKTGLQLFAEYLREID